MKSATVIRLDERRRPVETVDLADTETACKLLQRELIRTRFKTGQLAAESGLCTNTISKIAYGQTTRPMFNTVIRLLLAMGWTVTASR